MRYDVTIRATVEAKNLLDACIEASLIPRFYFKDIATADKHQSTGIAVGTPEMSLAVTLHQA